MTSTSARTTGTTRTTGYTDTTRSSRPLSATALAVGIAAAALAVLGPVVLRWLVPGEAAVIGVVTALSYFLPIAGVVLGHIARRREGARASSTVGLVLSYLAALSAVVPLAVDLVVFALQR
jgi:hypothetical protein